MQVASDRAASTAVEVVSFHSTSKGFLGECGLRGGYYELLNFPADVKARACSRHWVASSSSELERGSTRNVYTFWNADREATYKCKSNPPLRRFYRNE